MVFNGYIDLLIAICNSDDLKDKKDVIMVYDVKNNYIPYASFATAKSAAEFFKTSSESINSCISRKNKKQGKYILERVRLEEC